jgi:galactokinase
MVESGTARELQRSGYAERVSQCRAAVEILGIDSLRDATQEVVDTHRDRLDETLRRRVRHVVTENERVTATRIALEERDRSRLRELFDASHASLRDDYEVSTPEVDVLQRCAVSSEGVIGARLTGGGFGGCVVALVGADGAEAAAAEVQERYSAATGRNVRAWLSSPAGGARRI